MLLYGVSTGQYLFGSTDTVDSGGNYASGVACPLPARVQVWKIYVLQGLRVTWQTDRRGSAGLHGKEEGFCGIIAAQLAVECREGLPQTAGDEVRQHLIEV